VKRQNGNSGSGGEGKRRGGRRPRSWVPRSREFGDGFLLTKQKIPRRTRGFVMTEDRLLRRRSMCRPPYSSPYSSPYSWPPSKVSCSSDCPFLERLESAGRFFLFSPRIFCVPKSRRCQDASVLDHYILCARSFLSIPPTCRANLLPVTRYVNPEPT